ncbi:MAG: tetratricopeptide repeat protein [Rhodothermales bacterium]|nr:tetratricopeptide repeat protein [Rhodothermales bacterium]
MARILTLKSAQPQKFGYKKARRHAPSDAEQLGQIDLFAQPARIIRMPSRLGLFEEALLFDERGNREKAHEAYSRAIEADEYAADAYCNLGILESEAGRVDQAIDCFKNSLTRDPTLFESHFNLATVYFDLGDYRPAQVHYEIGASLEPEYANLYFNLALAFAMQDDRDGAIHALGTYCRLADPTESARAEPLLEALKQSVDIR